MRLAVATALEPGAIFTARPVAVIWLTRETKPYSLWPNSTRATSRRRIAPPSARMRSGISPNCSGVTRVSSTFTVALIGAESGTPRLPMSPTVRRALPAHGVDQVAGAEVHRGQLGRVGPDAHGVLGAPGLDLAHALHPAQRLQHVGRGDLAQFHGVVAAAGGGEGDDQLDAVRRLLHIDAVAPHRLGQARLDDLQAVLHFHRGEVGVHALAEGQGQRGLAGAAGGLGVEQAGRAVHLALDDRGHRFLDHLGRGAG